LEKKVISLVEVSRKLQLENVTLREESDRLRVQIDHLERSLLTHGQRASEIEDAKHLLDDLIRNIDLVVERELTKEQQKLETPS
jgi:hypothetical protein